MLKKNTTVLSVIMAFMIAFPSVNVTAAAKKQPAPAVRSIIPSTQTTAVNSIETVKIADFGAHSITEKGYETFDSSQAINKAIKYAVANKILSVDFGSGKYYAKDISLESNITYFSTQGAELIASPDIQLWHSVLTAINKTNVTIKGLTVNGNKNVVYGNSQEGSYLISFFTCNNINVENCYLYNNWYLAISLQNNCNYATIKNNKIYDTDCGISSQHSACNNLLIDGNTIYGSPENQMSEPISIYNSNVNGLAHDITITNNIVHDKSKGSGILVMNATKVLIKGNTAYNCYHGINVGIDAFMIGDNATVSNNITITENNIYNCTFGIRGELNNSLISKNKISDLAGIGISLFTPNGKPLINNDTIIDYTITNINSLGAREPAIRLSNTSSCVIDKNNVSDTRTKILHLVAIEILGENSTSNIIQNNTNLGATTSGYQIYIENAKNTTLENNIATILNQGIDLYFTRF